jgi:outer membrane protein OmpA-like peptidoglycan-associated protein
MRRLLIIWLVSSPWLVAGQSTNVFSFFGKNFTKAEVLYEQLAYRNALPLYLSVVEKDSANTVAWQRIADCYFKLGEVAEAEKWYAKLAEIPNSDPLQLYQYAQILTIRGKYKEAHKWLEKYTEAVGDDVRATSKLEFIDHISYYMRDSILYEVTRAPFNSDQSDFSPQYFDKGVVFVSARDRDLFFKHQPTTAQNENEAMLSVFYAPANDEKVTLFHEEKLQSSFHDGPVCFYDFGNKMSFSRNNLHGKKPVTSDGRVNLKLYFTETNNRSSSSTEAFPFNDDSYSIGHPWVSEDGELLIFASNMPSGFGGADLYMSRKQGGKWQEPENLGPTINTLGDEFYPYHANDSTLYFSSNGLGGLGGLDIYVSYKKNGVYSVPRNLGYPLNTSSDDFSLVTDHSGRHGLFSSNRPGGEGYDDIYAFSVKSFFLDGHVVERLDSSQHIAGATVTLRDEKGNALDTAISDARGRFSFDLSFDREYHFHVAKEGYTWVDSSAFSTRQRVLGHTSIKLGLWRHSLFAKGIIYSNESQSELKGATVILTDLQTGKQDSVVTDSTGIYRFLLQPGKNYKIGTSHHGFLPRELEINTHKIFDGNLLNDLVLEEVYIDKVVVQFEFDESDILDTELGKLDRMYKDLVRRPKTKLHISAFADSQGTHEHNQGLSDRRAAATVNYMIKKGIDRSRIEAKGFGESLLLNECSNGVDCEQHEHAVNRRAELKVQVPEELDR